MKMKTSLFAVAAAVLAGCASVPSTDDIPVVTNFDATKYMGTWYEIARLPNDYEKGMTCVIADYKLDADGRLHIRNRGWRGSEMTTTTAVGVFAGAKDVGAFRVSFFRPFYGAYRIVYLSPAYDLALVTGSDRSALWILSRTSKIDAAKREELVKKAMELGFDVDALEFAE